MTRWEDSGRSRLGLLTAFDEAEADLEAADFTDYSGEDHRALAVALKNETRALRDQSQMAYRLTRRARRDLLNILA